MSFFDSFFSSNSSPKPESWIELNDPKQLDKIIDSSNEKPQVIFKHSVRCDLSAMKKSGLIEQWNFDQKEFDFHYLDLINYRVISNLIESTFGIRHESPQLLLVRNGQVVFNTSHHGVNVEAIEKALGLRQGSIDQ